jgi:hypothetical protein
MPRCNGLVLGNPGVVGSPSICILYGQGSPTSQSAASIDPTQDNVQSCQIGSLWIDYQGGHHWNKTGMPTSANPNGVWNEIA